MDEINNLANLARKSLGGYCYKVCKSKCCKSGKILAMTKEELITIVGNKVNEYKNSKIIEESALGMGHTIDFTKTSCIQLNSELKCDVHGTTKQPTICKDYPLFITKQYVIASDECPAVNKGMLDSYIEKIEKLGLKRY